MPPPGRGRGRGRGRGGPHHHGPHGHPHPHPHGHGHPVAAAVHAVDHAVHHAAAAAAKPAEEEFRKLYHKADKQVVVIQHSLGKHLRAKPGDRETLDYEGGTGMWARWRVHVHDDAGESVQFENMKTGKFLRMKPNGDDFDVGGIPKGPNTFFIMERKSTGVAWLKTRKEYHDKKQAYLAVMHGQLPQKRLKFFVAGKPRDWEKGYQFAQKNVVVIQHSQGFHNIRVNPDDRDEVDMGGKCGKWARWEAEPDHQNHTVRLKSDATQRYLRIRGDDGDKVDCDGKGGGLTIFKVHHIGEDKHYVKLESLRHPGKFLAVRHDGIKVGAGGRFCALTFYRE